jgi:hypothetical protein
MYVYGIACFGTPCAGSGAVDFVRCTYTELLALEHPVLAVELFELCGLFCCIQGSVSSSVSE